VWQTHGFHYLQRLDSPADYHFLRAHLQAHMPLTDECFANFQPYQHFLRKYLGIAQQVPQHFIASYLGSTPEWLSRVGRQL
jgi:hypothetical protein